MQDATSSSARDLGRYRLIARLAVGGMAELFLARERGLAGLERLVVIKRILPHLADDPTFIEMFLREARIIARLNHPNVVQIYELSEEEGAYFIAMEYIEGCTLRELQRLGAAQARPLPLGVALTIVVEACRGLHAAHTLRDLDDRPLGLVHRDVSPQNLMVTPEGRVKLLDFGVAKATCGQEATHSGALKGKFAYMSPEQCRGEALDQRSDLFSLGVVLWELCTGQALFKRGSELAMLRAVDAAQVPAPSDVGAALPPPIEAAIMRALARDPADRHPSSEAMRVALLDACRASRVDVERDVMGAHVAAVAGDLIATRLQRLDAAEDEAAPGRAVTLRGAGLPEVDGAPTVGARPRRVSAADSLGADPTPGPEDATPPLRLDPATLSRSPAEPGGAAGLRWSERTWLVVLLLALVGGLGWWARPDELAPHPVSASAPTAPLTDASASPDPDDRRAPLDAPPARPTLDGAALIVGWPPVVDPVVVREEIEPLRRYLERALERPVRFIITDDYAELSRQLIDGRVDFGVLPPLLYVRTRARVPQIEALATREFDGAVGSDAYLLVRQEMATRRLDDLRGHRFCLTDPNSTSGHFMALAYLRAQGLDPERFIGSVHMSGGHFQAMRDLLAGTCAAAATYSGAWLTAHERGVPSGQLRVLAVTGYTPQDAVCAAPSTTADVRERFTQALLDFEPLRDIGLERLGVTQRITGFEPATPELYEQLAALQRHEWAASAARAMRLGARAAAARAAPR